MPFLELKYFSNALQMATAANIILPNPEVKGPYHVMFLLHGLSDDHTIWSRRTSIERYVEGLPLIVVMPNGGRGWYCDAVNGSAYETAIATELPRIIEAYLPTRPGWCVTGLSMGGYGAAKLAMKYPTRFRSGHSHSGAMLYGSLKFEESRFKDRVGADVQPELVRILGVDPRGGPNDLLAISKALAPANRPHFRFDCGVDDFLLDENRQFRDHLENIGFPHDYEEFTGDHSWPYWDEHVQDALKFHGRNLGF
jgi:S-formylglutathione hydrolase FrmB